MLWFHEIQVPFDGTESCCCYETCMFQLGTKEIDAEYRFFVANLKWRKPTWSELTFLRRPAWVPTRIDEVQDPNSPQN